MGITFFVKPMTEKTPNTISSRIYIEPVVGIYKELYPASKRLMRDSLFYWYNMDLLATKIQPQVDLIHSKGGCWLRNHLGFN